MFYLCGPTRWGEEREVLKQKKKIWALVYFKYLNCLCYQIRIFNCAVPFFQLIFL